jgi:hypothetical protein
MKLELTNGDEQTPSPLRAADHLGWWADSLPNRTEVGDEPWYEFLERRYRAEVALIERLLRSPHFWLETCPPRSHVELTLGGISVRTEEDIAAALQEWARRAREQVG